MHRLLPVSLLALTATVSADPCCKTCEAPKVKYFSVDTPHGHCGECCMDPKHFELFKFFEKNLTLANSTTCADLGWSKYDSTVTHGFGPVSMTLDLYNHAGEVGNDVWEESVTLYSIRDDGRECYQASCSTGLCETLLIASSDMTPGTCASQGYTQADGTVKRYEPVIGKVTFSKFKKPELRAQDEVTLFKVDHDECGQVSVDKKYESEAIHYGGMREGTCKSQGYTVADGTTKLRVPVLGPLTAYKFKKPGNVEEFDKVLV